MVGAHASVKGHRDFRRLWAGRAVSQFGSDVGAIALPLVAVTIVEASVFEVTVLAVVSAVTTVGVSFPLGRYVEYRRKRPVMILADVVRFAALVSIPAFALAGGLTFAHLCVVAAGNAVCMIAFAAASQAHLKALVPAQLLVDANGRLEATTWLSLTVGRSLGGVLIGALSLLGALLVDAVSFLVGAWAVARLRSPEPAPPSRETVQRRREQLLAGLHFVRSDRVLRRVLTSWVVFAGASGMAFPIATVFYVRDLHFTAWQYGLLMGLPSLGGFAGARVVRSAVARWGTIDVLRWASFIRAPWYALIPLAWPGTGGLILCGLGFTGVLFFSAVANSTMTTYRQLGTPDHLQVRVSALWTFAATVTQPVFILLGGGLAAFTSNRIALAAAAAAMCAAAFILPRTTGSDE